MQCRLGKCKYNVNVQSLEYNPCILCHTFQHENFNIMNRRMLIHVTQMYDMLTG